MPALDDAALAQLFLDARTHNAWQEREVDDDPLRRLYDLARMGPTSANMLPMRLVFVKSAEAKAKLEPALDPGNVDKTMSAPVTAIVAHDLAFYEHAPRLFPAFDIKSAFASMSPTGRERVALTNGTLQGAYLILAARALGLDCGPMAGFDGAQVDAAFFEGSTWRTNFLLNIGYGDSAGLYPRGPRFDFDEVVRIA